MAGRGDRLRRSPVKMQPVVTDCKTNEIIRRSLTVF